MFKVQRLIFRYKNIILFSCQSLLLCTNVPNDRKSLHHNLTSNLSSFESFVRNITAEMEFCVCNFG